MLRSRAFLSLNLAHFFDHFVLMILPTAALATGADYALSLSPAAWAFTACALATLPAGWLGDRWGRVAMMRVFWFGTGAACLVAGLAPGSWGLVAGLALIGLFAAIYHPVATAMVMGFQERAGDALAVNGVWGNMGVAAAALTTALLAEWVSWRVAFVVPGLVMLALGCHYATIPAAAQSASATTARRAPAEPPAQLRIIAFIAISGLFGGLVFTGATIALPQLLAERLPWAGLALVGVIAALVFAVLALPVMPLVFGEIPITAWLLGRHLGERWWSRAYALQYLLSLGVAVGTVPLITTLHRATGDQTVLFVALAACSATILASAFLVPTTRAPCQPAGATSALAD